MTNTFNSSDKVGEIVAQFPGAADIFKDYGIDFCCGGDKPLLVPLKEQSIDEKELLDKLSKAYLEYEQIKDKGTDWKNESFTNLSNYVINTHHAYLHKEMPELSKLTTTILRVHGSNHKELAKVHKLFHSLKTDLEQHLISEEVNIYPMIKEYDKEPSKDLLEKILSQLDELESEHEETGNILKELRRVTDNYTVPDDACLTYDNTYKKLEEFESDMFNHVHLENNILFPRLEKELDKYK